MPLLAKCPLCRGVMPDAEGEARCPRCGEMVLPSFRKLCVTCGRDLTHDRRARDETGEYLCPECWAARLASRGEVPVYTCQTCQNTYPADQMYQAGRELICHACYAERNVDPDALLEEAAHVGDFTPATSLAASTDAPRVYQSYYSAPARQNQGTPWGWIWAAVIVLFLTIGSIVYLSRGG